jgi:hypothetical protein
MNDLQPSIVLILEKPAQAHAIAPLVTTYWPGKRVMAIYTFYLGLYEFRYPRGLTYAELPYTRDPVWKKRDFAAFARAPVVEFIDGQVLKADFEPALILTNAETIWYGCDPDASGANAYQVLLTECLGAELAAKERPAMFMRSMDDRSLRDALDASTTTAIPQFQKWLKSGEAKRFFDYNFNVNSLAILGECLRAVGVNTTNYGISKYSIQLLYVLKESGQLKESRVLQMMDQWPGTGRYGLSSLGSPASRGKILQGLVQAGLLDQSGMLICLSDRGREFIELLHPDCQDRDLPARLNEWQVQWPESRGKVERYLRTFFGKQLKFGARP